MRVVLLVLVLGVSASLGACSLKSSPPPPPTVVLYGDSLGFQSGPYFKTGVTARTNASPVTRVFGGLALCDWLGQISDDLTTLRPSVITLEFVGNNLTSCMGGLVWESPPYYAKYRADMQTAFQDATVARAQVVWAIPPPMRNPDGTANNAALADIARQLALTYTNVHVVDAGAAVSVDGAYADPMPCLPSELALTWCISGQIRVRNDDGTHLYCPESEIDPVTGWPRACPDYSSGEYRFGDSMAAATTALLATTTPTTSATTTTIAGASP